MPASRYSSQYGTFIHDPALAYATVDRPIDSHHRLELREDALRKVSCRRAAKGILWAEACPA